MRLGVVMLPTDPWPETTARARRLEHLGFDHLWAYDHLSWRRYRGRPWFNAVPWLAGLAGVTDRVELGTLVASPNFRHPLTLASEAITLDHVSNGRFLLGVGAGGPGFDATVFGEQQISPRQRAERLDEFVALLGRLFAEHEVSFDGAYYRVHEAVIEPGAVRAPHVPIAVAAGGRRTLGTVARHADAWITFGPDDVVREQAQQLDAACEAIDRDPSSIRRFFMHGNTDDRQFVSVDAFMARLAQWERLGFTDVIVHFPRADDPAWNEPEELLEEIAAAIQTGR